MLSCPSCHKLIYAEALNQLPPRTKAPSTPNRSDGLRKALTLVPPGTTQYTPSQTKIRTLQAEIDGTKEAILVPGFP